LLKGINCLLTTSNIADIQSLHLHGRYSPWSRHILSTVYPGSAVTRQMISRAKMVTAMSASNMVW
jgi:hypothetical protein